MKSLFLFSGQEAFLHRVDPRAKFVLVLAVLAYVLLFENPMYMAGAFVIVMVVLWVLGNISPLEYWTVLVLFLPLILGVTVIQALTNHPPGSVELFSLGPIGVSQVGLLVGLSVGVRLATMGLTFMMFSMTTAPSKVGLALYKSGVPFRYAYLATFGLRFLPLMQEDLGTLQNARSARGDPNVGSRNPIRRLSTLPKTFFPLAANSLRQSSETAKALELRGYGAKTTRTTVDDIAMRASDYAIVVASVALVAAVAYARFALGLGTLGGAGL
jgi:energy-coupling factor transport system permease protein